MIEAEDTGIVLEPTERSFESKAVLNPACAKIGQITHLFYRAVDQNNQSTIGYCQIENGKVINRSTEPLLFPEHDYERCGLEDPRLTYIDGLYYLFYTAYDGKNARVAYATAKQLPHFTKAGLVSPSISYERAMQAMKKQPVSIEYEAFGENYKTDRGKDIMLWEKDSFLFPEKINGMFYLVHRILPNIQLICFERFSNLTLSFWEKSLARLDDNTVLKQQYWFENRNIGGGCPPLKTKAGWLFVYHAVENTHAGRIYRAGIALLDLHDPRKVISRLPEPLFGPEADWEKDGVVDNVVFPTSLVVEENHLLVYYGAADRVIGLKKFRLSEILEELQQYQVRPELYIVGEKA